MKAILSTLDTEFITPNSRQTYQNLPNVFEAQILPQLKQQSAIIINGSPYGSKSAFQETWRNLPQTQHNLLSFDCHVIPGSHTFLITASVKVRFDESGKNRVGVTSELVQSPELKSQNARCYWGPSFGATLVLVVDDVIVSNWELECISSLDYRFTFKPENALFKL